MDGRLPFLGPSACSVWRRELQKVPHQFNIELELGRLSLLASRSRSRSRQSHTTCTKHSFLSPDPGTQLGELNTSCYLLQAQRVVSFLLILVFLPSFEELRHANIVPFPTTAT